jgi:hypothetical protein
MPKKEMMMKTDEEKAKEVNDYILKWSKLRPTSRGYKALSILLENSNLLYCYLGKDDTLELSKVLIYLKCHYNFKPGGLELTLEHKLRFYHAIMYPTKQHYNAENTFISKSDRRLSVGKEERSTSRHWAHDILASKDKPE